MQLIKSLSKSKVVKVLTLALVLAGAISGVKLTQAANTAILEVRVFEGSASNNIMVSGARVNLSNGATGVTNNSGSVVFNDVPFGVYRVEIRSNPHYDRNYENVIVDMDTRLDASITPLTTGGGDGGSTVDGCTPAPARGSPMLNIWPLAANGAKCTDYPLLMVKNVTQGTGYVNGSAVNAQPGDTLRVQLYVHNGVLDYPENEAKNVGLKANVPGTAGSALISAEAWASNANAINSSQKGGNVTINMSGNSTLSYVDGSSKLYDRNFGNERAFSASVVNSGASLGNMRGCFDFLHFVTFDLKVTAPVIVVPPPAPKATLVVEKKVVGGTLGVNDFELFVGDTKVTSGQANTFEPGIYFVRENNKPNYTAAFTGECGANGRINLASGDNKVCTITNTFKPVIVDGTLSITKNVRNVTQGQTTFINSVSAKPGEQVEFQMEVTASFGTVNNVIFSDQLPSRLTYVNNSLTVDGVASGNNLGAVTLGNMTAGQTKKVIIRATVNAASEFPTGNTTLTNTAHATSSANSVTATANVVVSIAQPSTVSITIDKGVRNVTQNQTGFSNSVSANFGDTVQFQVKVTSTGNSTANNVVLTDSLPSALTLATGSTLTHNLGNMNAGSSQTVLISAVVPAESNFNCGSTGIVNTASATASNASSVSDSATVNVNRTNNCGGGSSASLSLTKEVRNVTQNSGFGNNANAVNGERVEFRLIVRAFNGTAVNARITDSLPSGLVYVPGTFQIDSGISTGNIFGGNYQNLGNLSSGLSRTILFQATVNSTISQTLINQASATSDNTGSVNAQATVFVSTVLGGNIDLVLSKSAYNQTRNVDATTVTAQPNDVIVYTLRVRNQGNATATGFVITDNISDVLQHSRLNTFEGAAFDMGQLTLTWPAVSIPAGTTVERQFSVVVNPTSPAGSDNLMTNIYGNTVNVRVARVAGMVAPPTGPTATASIALAIATMIGYWGVRKQKFNSIINFLTQKNV